MMVKMHDVSSLSPIQLYRIVFAHSRLNVDSDNLLYLLEPHLLKHLGSYKPSQLNTLFEAYFRLGQGTA